MQVSSVRWRQAVVGREGERRGIRVTPFQRRHVLITTTRAAHIVDVFLCDHQNARPLTTPGVPLSMQLNGDLLPRSVRLFCWHRSSTRTLGWTELWAANFSIARLTPGGFTGEKRTELILGFQKAASPESIAQGKHALAEPLAARARNAWGESLLFFFTATY